MKAIVCGARGRMGRAIMSTGGDFEFVGIARGDVLEPAVATTDVVIDFSVRAESRRFATLSAMYGKPFVLGTTGHTDDERAEIAKLGEVIPIVWDANFSLGMSVLLGLVAEACRLVDPDWNAEIVEAHRLGKLDSPSGTAKQLRAAICRQKKCMIPTHSLRIGNVVGDHLVVLAGPSERIEFTHRVDDRKAFASGALRAARWAIGKKPGLYDMQDVLGIMDGL